MEKGSRVLHINGGTGVITHIGSMGGEIGLPMVAEVRWDGGSHDTTSVFPTDLIDLEQVVRETLVT